MKRVVEIGMCLLVSSGCLVFDGVRPCLPPSETPVCDNSSVDNHAERNAGDAGEALSLHRILKDGEEDDFDTILDLCFQLRRYYNGKKEIIESTVASGLGKRIPRRNGSGDETVQRRMARLKTLDMVFHRLVNRQLLESGAAMVASDTPEFSPFVGTEEDILTRSLASSIATICKFDLVDFSCLTASDPETAKDGETILPLQDFKRLLEEEVNEAGKEYARIDKAVFLHEYASDIGGTAIPPPDFCIILVDSLRPDHLGYYGYRRDTSPFVDLFAAEGTLFEQAVASAPWTQPSVMTLFTSVEPGIHHRAAWQDEPDTNLVTLAGALRAAGYQTAGFTSNPLTNRKFGYARGFDVYDDFSACAAPGADTDEVARRAATGARSAASVEEWLRTSRDPSRPLFLYVLLFDVHWDYLPPAPYNDLFAPDPVPAPRNLWKMGGADVPPVVRERAVAAYDGEIRYTDDIVRLLLAAFDAQPHPGGAVAVLCSDHGEAFWERGSPAHGNNLHEEEIRVPLVMRGKGVPAGMRIRGQVGLIDVAPTLLDLAGIPAPESWRGRSLMPAMLGAPQPELPLVLDNRIQKRGIQRGVRTSRWKLSAWPPHDAPGELYDLAADPGETNNLARSGAPLPAEVQTLVPLLKPPK